MAVQHPSHKLINEYREIRRITEEICAALVIEDYVIQSIDDVSPPKWHLAHTTWFFETFLLIPHLNNYKVFDPLYQYLFNSYYQRLNQPFPRYQRGLLARPTVQQVYDYRHYINKHIEDLLQTKTLNHDVYQILQLGLQHEQQHQELLLMDIKYNFSLNPDFPPYVTQSQKSNHDTNKLHFIPIKGGVTAMGFAEEGFSFDNEKPRHKQILNDYAIANRLITNGEYLEFINAGGYQNPTWWLSDGWDAVCKNSWLAPLYWYKHDNEWCMYTLHGLTNINLAEPVSHVSYYEACAYANFVNKRLPTELEWEHIASSEQISGNFLENKLYQPAAIHKNENKVQQLYGDVWEWTASPYIAYPGFKAASTAIGEYNGKFMSNQMVLRGGSCVTPRKHIRASYRNFFQPEKRWQFSGIRLAE